MDPEQGERPEKPLIDFNRVEIDSICRVCLKQEPLQEFKPGLFQFYTKIVKEDPSLNLPRAVCWECKHSVYNLWAFIKNCQENEQLLQKSYSVWQKARIDRQFLINDTKDFKITIKDLLKPDEAVCEQHEALPNASFDPDTMNLTGAVDNQQCMESQKLPQVDNQRCNETLRESQYVQKLATILKNSKNDLATKDALNGCSKQSVQDKLVDVESLKNITDKNTSASKRETVESQQDENLAPNDKLQSSSIYFSRVFQPPAKPKKLGKREYCYKCDQFLPYGKVYRDHVALHELIKKKCEEKTEESKNTDDNETNGRTEGVGVVKVEEVLIKEELFEKGLEKINSFSAGFEKTEMIEKKISIKNENVSDDEIMEIDVGEDSFGIDENVPHRTRKAPRISHPEGPGEKMKGSILEVMTEKNAKSLIH